MDGGDASPFDFFLMLFPPQKLTAMVRMINKQLISKSLLQTSTVEMLKFFGVMVLCTRFKFGSGAALWSRRAPGKYVPAPSFGTIGMARQRFDALWAAVQFCEKLSVRPASMGSERNRWLLVDDFVTRFNEHRAMYFNSSDRICVDESMSRWYGQGEFGINKGLPQYIAIDRKPENGCQIQNEACGTSMIMIRLRLVQTAEGEDPGEDEAGVPHGAQVLRKHVNPWRMTGRVVCADSYFASVFAAAIYMKNIGYVLLVW